MLYLVQSNRMESLAALLANELKTPLATQPALANEQILVQSPGMATWLRLTIAAQNNIAAALEFPLPSSFIWRLFHKLLVDVPQNNAYTKEAMTWKLMALLPQLIQQPVFAPLANYLTTSSPENDSPLKLYQLCHQIADVFDQYLIYRPDWILAWEEGNSESPPNNEIQIPTQAWQAVLWRKLIDYSNEQQPDQNHSHRANLHRALFDILDRDDCPLTALPERLFVFGISSMAPQTLEVLHFLAKHIDVVIFALSPCQHYWGDIVDPRLRAKIALQYADKQQLVIDWEDKLEVGNPLLANNGKLGRELLDLILTLPETNTNFDIDCYQEPENDNLLHGLQGDILNLTTRGETLKADGTLYLTVEGRRLLDANDDSITFRSCHSPLRELETLHDHLLDVLSKSSTNDTPLTPKDIVVMMPDVSAYAPYIDAVFAAKNGAHYIPYAITDRGAAQESPLIRSFLQLLSINNSRFALSDILSILEVPAVLRRFEINENQLQIIRNWLEQAGVRWGRDANGRTAQQLPPFEQNSWAFGIKRLILGYCFSDDAPIYQETVAVDGVEGHAVQALGKLLNFIESLDQASQQLAEQSCLAKRIAQLYELVAHFYEADEEEEQQLQEIHSAIGSFNDELSQASYDDPINIDLLHYWFTRWLSQPRLGQRYLAGSVNFCTLMPMRSIPFKVVCLLGMNDGVYPRVQHPTGFDLIGQSAARKGDRSRRLDDRYLFLEALISAREQFYVSFIGNSERDNSERNPSILVAELIEYCQLCYLPQSLSEQTTATKPNIALIEEKIIQQLITIQPLQPFDQRLYQQDSLLQQSYDSQWCSGAASKNNDEATKTDRFINKPLKIDNDNADQELALPTLIRFYRNPARYFFNRSLKLNFGLDIKNEDDDEPFSIDALSRYKLQMKLIDNAISHQQPQPDKALLHRLKLGGRLPLKPFDDLILDQYIKDIKPLIERVLHLSGAQLRSIDIALNINNTINNQLNGRIDSISPRGLINYRPGTANASDIIRLYLRHLCINASNTSDEQSLSASYLLDIGHFHNFAAIDADDALERLSLWVNYFNQGQQSPLMFIPKTALAYVTADGDHSQKLASAQPQWLNEQNNSGEGFEPHYRRLFMFPDDFTEVEFGNTANNLLQPMLDIYHTAKLGELESFIEGKTK